ncbi:lysine transporter LysE [Natronospirillum operosum]|uniref:Lysine transporter LysE n=1 Tax=Natronospirillum operosum TaxID=2759953 RepID=A0A4Z0WJL5_9GAMM|nr:lysine transporter LysE [Natronospirillum operosum]
MTFLTGFGIALGLIVAIGAQNAWVLNKSMRGEHPAIIAAVCFSIDATLISIGTFSIDAIQQRVPALVPVMTLLGVLLLTFLAMQAFWRAWQGGGRLQPTAATRAASRWKTAGQAAAISLLNPHVYLDTLVLVGSVGAQQTAPLVFVLGAALGSAVWFFSLAFCGQLLGPRLQSQRAWRIFDCLIGLIMMLVAVSLLL